ncbi:hypothetical protein [Dickeya sp. ws52]|uniref:hypothetical protein n=1 Tax=Dickeya sp. ws52 TaxID=2576377 RepID=UPI001180AD67|nr:hypothetical protein [Dickeya sp. ws52]TYL41588.1 hypothetical protein FDP13_17185 [Dickeya sp. ws52]
MSKKNLRKRKNNSEYGECKLTRKHGKYIDSHILPRSITILSRNGERAIEAGIDIPTKKKFQGWYDNELVIAEGEKYLTELDTKGIKELRKNKLIWSGWPTSMTTLDDSETFLDERSGIGYRVINNIDHKLIKLFFMSLLWRASASERYEMKDVKLPQEKIETLRNSIINHDDLNLIDFPIIFDQIITKGIVHNRTPIMEEIGIPFHDGSEKKYKSCRFYFDGLITRIILNPDSEIIENLGPLILGNKNKLLLTIHTFDSSRAKEDLQHVIKNA